MIRLPALPHGVRTLYGGLLLGTVIALVMLLVLQHLPLFSRAELAAYDWHFQVRGGRPQPTDILVVAVDRASVAHFPHRGFPILPGGRYPLFRRYQGNAVSFLHRAGARAIGLFFFYPGPSPFGKNDDQDLALAIKRAGNVVLIDVLLRGGGIYVPGSGRFDPPALLRNKAAAVGFANLLPDDDGTVRSVSLSTSTRAPRVGLTRISARSMGRGSTYSS